MAFFRRKNRRHLIPLHRDNATNEDWVVILEANTIVGPDREPLRVACATRERKVVKRLRSFKLQLFLLLEHYDPRIHVLFFCPQLYQYDKDGALVPLRSDEIGRFVARALDDKTAVRRPWYNPIESLPGRPLVAEPMLDDYDTLLVESPALQPLLPAPIGEEVNVGAKREQLA
jgi:hypothetical protein